MVTVKCRSCIKCDESANVDVPLDGYNEWKHGASVQVAFPGLDVDTRELLISGVHPECWEKMYGDDDE